MKKVILIGIDGATPGLLEKWIDEGHLPNFKKIKDNGIYGRLNSTIPPFSAPSWTTIVTGCNLGKHGIYGFECIDTLETNLINSRYRKVPAFWNYLTDIGLNSIVINVPVSYPPDKINGVMITGLLTPSKELQYTYPANLKNRLNKNDLGEYELESIWLEDYPRSHLSKHAPERLLKIINDQMETRANVTIKLMKEQPWNITMVVLRGTDTAQHFLFDKKDLLLKCYKKVDELVNRIINTEPDATVYIVSDHGFMEIKKIFYPDNLLYNKRFLKPIIEPYKSLNSKINAILTEIFTRILRIIPAEKIKNSSVLKNILFSSTSKRKIIDFSKTKSFCIAEGRGIQINLKGRYDEGIVSQEAYEKTRDELINILINLEDPENNDRFIEAVFKGNELYGKDAINPLDLVIVPKKGYITSEGLRRFESFSNKLLMNIDNLPILFSNDHSYRTGDHTQFGIFFAYGNNIKKDKIIEKISVMDILPQLFVSLNIPIPNIVDGKVLDELFVKKPHVRYVDWDKYFKDKKILTFSEELRIKRLREKMKI